MEGAEAWSAKSIKRCFCVFTFLKKAYQRLVL